MSKVSLKVIGLGFIYMYFEGMKKNPEKVANFYSEESEVVFADVSKLDGQSHDTFPVVKLHKKDSIKEYFQTNSSQLKSIKLKIKTFDCQSISGHANSILLLTLTGEVIWDSTQAYNFTQTFILKNLKDAEEVYEVSNSVFRITTDVTTPSTSSTTTNNKCRNASNGRTKTKNEHYNNSMNNTNNNYSRNRNSGNMNNYENAANNNNVMFYPQNMMMNEYYQYPNYIPTNFNYYNANMNNYQRYSGKKYNSRYERYNERGSNGHESNNENNLKKVNYYSVNVMNTRDMTEDQIRHTLEKEFGPIGKITTGENFTIVGFENSSSEIECLAKKETTIDGSVITFEKK
ncbi:hypothetical protein C6P45_003126 [Maudiozyma exigua]|uniref:NTF2 domain-containing protein n=1 Tax=Maudiozyma exigua TaxID=34358 RepID=A0A9P7BB79_MAUEX|nr:hypothetical protein C6P45_003126 [Kazachstania exigua]